jgi:hypothetical protein
MTAGNMHVFPLIDFGHPEPHHPTELCRCQPTPQLDANKKLIWIHKPFAQEDIAYYDNPLQNIPVTAQSYTADEALDLIKQAEAINDATSVNLWSEAEAKKLKVKVIPFSNLNPIHLPKSQHRGL